MITQKIIARTDSLKLDKIISRYGEDSMRQVVFIIVRPDPESEDLIPITIPEDAVGSFRILKPSGNFVIVPMSKSVLASGETAFDVVLPASANTSKGSGYYDIRITSETDKYYFTAQGDFIIDDNIISDEVLEDVSEVNGLIFPDDFLTVEDHVAYIDDDTISTDSTWSSDKINDEIEAHAGGDVSKTVSGNPITFDDGADAPLVKCVTQITGSQDLHGYDKPWVGGAGKNKFEVTSTSQTVNGVVYSVENDGKVIANNTATADSTFLLGTLNVTPDAAYYLKASSGTAASYLMRGVVRDSNDVGIVIDGTVFQDAYNNTDRRILMPSNAVTMSVYAVVKNGVTANNTLFEPMVYLSGNSDFEPYSNICPITAYTEGEIEVRGKNLFDYTQSQNISSFQRGASIIFSPSDARIVACGGKVKNGKAYTFSFPSGVKIATMFYYENDTLPLNQGSGSIVGTNISVENASGVYTFTATETNYVYFYFAQTQGQTTLPISTLSTAQLEKGAQPTTYEPYTSTTHTTTYPSAIYRGSEDVVNGTVVTDWGMIASYAGETLPGDWISDRDEYAPGTTPTTGAQVAYALATPTTSSVTPTNQPIKSLSGYNHIESTTGDMEVEYITQRFQPLIDSIAQL